MKKDFAESQKILQSYKEKESVNGEFGKPLWQIEHPNFILECWLCNKTREVVIFQIWEAKAGFQIWKMVPEL